MSRRALWFCIFLACATPAPGNTDKAASIRNCSAPDTVVERTVCASDELSTLERDIRSAYERALEAIGHSGKSALRRDQNAYQSALDAAAAKSTFDLPVRMAIRRDFLNLIRPSGGEWAGSWANANATIDIEHVAGANYKVRLHAADAVNGRWVCEIDETAVAARSVMIVGAESAAEVAGGPNEGWTLALRIAGDILLVEPLRPRGNTGPIPFCSAGGNVAGNFFAQDHNLQGVDNAAATERK